MKEIINETIKVLSKSGVILYPTDTIWGLGCDPQDEMAISTIYGIKQRSETKSMLVLVNSVEMLEDYVEYIPDVAYQLIEAASRPLTIIYPKAKNLASNLIAPDGSIGIRIAQCDLCQALVTAHGKPIVSTSANIAGQKSPLGFFDVSNEIKMAVDYIVPYKLNEFSPAKSSDIIKVHKSGKIDVIR
ncbi:MAG: threonylcarbamoyl-AMP synthase [Marinilabiliales bacterium]|nr:MAG: threonylcarbamoyl-AMP synthase [Marinilabiliales bacterium]